MGNLFGSYRKSSLQKGREKLGRRFAGRPPQDGQHLDNGFVTPFVALARSAIIYTYIIIGSCNTEVAIQ